jgi:coiled-coil-helix-coiled-coil-helix domain-containing protein 2
MGTRTDKIKIRGVAVGSSIGHAIGGFFGGGSNAASEQQQSAAATQGQEQARDSWGPKSCEVDAKQFTKCLDENQGNMQICGWYLDQLVRCQTRSTTEGASLS